VEEVLKERQQRLGAIHVQKRARPGDHRRDDGQLERLFPARSRDSNRVHKSPMMGAKRRKEKSKLV
jgi:hypothetical protein